MIQQLLTPQLIDAIGWTLLHSLWQGAASAIILVLLLIAMKKYSAQARYTVSVTMLCTFFLAVAVTFYNQWTTSSILATQVSTDVTVVADDVISKTSAPVLNGVSTTDQVGAPIQSEAEKTHWLTWFRNYYSQHLPLLVTLWLLGILVLQLRFLGQLAYVQRLKHYGTQAIPSSWNDKIEELESKLRIRKNVQYLTSIRISSPMVIGWLKPAILFPKDLFEKLSDTEIYTVLAHELAHIRREDFVVNLIQNFLCNLFFFHPGVWWMSGRVDEEREHCCDDLAMSNTGTPITYARTLINISQYNLTAQGESQHLAVALAGKNRGQSRFTYRIKRLLVHNRGSDSFKEGFTSAIILFAVLGLGSMATGQINKTRLNNDESSNTINQIDVKDELKSTSKFIVDNSDEVPIQASNNPVKPVKPELPNYSNEMGVVQLPINREYEHDESLEILIKACNEGDLTEVKRLLAMGVDINAIGSNGFTPLMAAVNNNNVKTVEYLIEQGVDINEVSSGWSALIEAADEGAKESIQLLIDAGADINYYRSPMSPTAISMAASEGYLDCLKLLEKNGADINGVSKSEPPLHKAAEEGQLEIIQYLLSRRVDVNKQNAYGQTALMFAASEGNVKAAELLIAGGANKNLTDRKGNTASDFARDQEEEGMVYYLRSLEARINSATLPDIHKATQDGLIEKVRKMVENGADINERDQYGRTPLHIATIENHNIDMKVLIDLGAEMNVKDDNEKTPLMYAMDNGNPNTIILLVQENANIHIVDDHGRVAHEWDRSRGEDGLEEFINEILTEHSKRHEEEPNLQSKASLKKKLKKVIRDLNEGETFHVNPEGTHLQQYNIKNGAPILMNLVSNGMFSECEKALNNGISANVADDTGQTPLMVAAHNNFLDIAVLLIENGAHVSQGSYSGLTALHYASIENHVEMAELLLKHDADIDAEMQYSSTDGSNDKDPLVCAFQGASPLFVATENKSKEVLELLIAAGADPHHLVTKTTYAFKPDRDQTYLSGGEVVGLDQEFLKQVEVKDKDDSWSPYKQAVLLNESDILIYFNH